MKIVKKEAVNHVQKEGGPAVWYYLFDEYEVHYNEQPPGTTQRWHHHEQIWETLYLIEGELTAEWEDEKGAHSEIVAAGDLVEVEYDSHTFTNHTDSEVKFLVIKQVLAGRNNRDLFKSDKVVDEQ